MPNCVESDIVIIVIFPNTHTHLLYYFICECVRVNFRCYALFGTIFRYIYIYIGIGIVILSAHIITIQDDKFVAFAVDNVRRGIYGLFLALLVLIKLIRIWNASPHTAKRKINRNHYIKSEPKTHWMLNWMWITWSHELQPTLPLSTTSAHKQQMLDSKCASRSKNVSFALYQKARKFKNKNLFHF